MPDPFLSIVIPAYNEELRIANTLAAVRCYAGRKQYPVELIVVDDGSTDRTREVVAREPMARILSNSRNRGKGFSVRRGVLEARGELVLFTDADLSAPIEECDKLLDALASSGADVAVGSRALQRKLIGVHQSWFREWGGRFFNLMVRLATGLRIHDTQCGFKLFRRQSTLRAFELQRVDGFGFDAEVLFLIARLGGKLVEVPVRWNHSSATKVHYLRDSARMSLDLVVLRWRTWRRKYPTSSG